MTSQLVQEFTDKILPLIPEGYRKEIREMPPHERKRVSQVGLDLLEDGWTDFAEIVDRVQFEVSNIQCH